MSALQLNSGRSLVILTKGKYRPITALRKEPLSNDELYERIHMKFLVVIGLATCTIFSLCANANETQPRQKVAPSIVKKYVIDYIYFDNEDHKLYAFGHMQTEYLDEDHAPTTEEPKILRISEDGKFEAEINAAFFGLEHYGVEEHAYDGQSTQTWFVDSAHSRILRFKGNPQSATDAFAPLLIRGPTPERFIVPGKIPMYGFRVSIAGSPQHIWVALIEGGHASFLARDEKNGLLWQDHDGILNISSDATSQPVSYQQHRSASAIFPDERDGTAWIYISNDKVGELRHLDRNGNTINKLPIAKYLTSTGSRNRIAIDFKREQIWYADIVYPYKLVQLSLSGERKLELNIQQITGTPNGNCPNSSLALQEDGALWLYCSKWGIYKFDASGKRLLEVESTGPLQFRSSSTGSLPSSELKNFSFNKCSSSNYLIEEKCRP